MRLVILLALLLCASPLAAQLVVGGRDYDGAVITSVGGNSAQVFSLTVTQVSGSPSDVGHGTRAYAFCLREAQAQARRGRAGHIFGIAPGAGMQGIGDSFSGSSPNHCTGIGLIARAGVKGANNRWYWSAAYRR